MVSHIIQVLQLLHSLLILFFTQTMTHDSGNNTGGGCFSGVTRLLLCRGSLQTHPSDDIITISKPIPTIDHHILNRESKSMENLNLNLKVEATSTSTKMPGVVARLMGLESLPDPNIVTRSRSVNFMDYYFLDSTCDLESKHRRVRTCVSFREEPVVFSNEIDEKENDFFVFSLDDDHMVDKTKKSVKKISNQEKNGYAKMSVENHVKLKKKEKNKKLIVEGVVLNKNKKDKNSKDVEVQRMKQIIVSNDKAKRISRFRSCKGVSSGFVCTRKNDGIPVKKVKTPVNPKEVIVESKFMKKIKNHHCNANDEFHHHQHQLPLSGKKSSPQVNNYKSTEQKRVRKKEYKEEVKKQSKWTEEDMEESKWVNIEIEDICFYFGEQIVDLLVLKLVEELVHH